MTTKQSHRIWRIITIGLVAAIASALMVLNSVQADQSDPIEGHFTAPDIPSNETRSTTSTNAGSEPGYYQTSEYMIGTVAVGLILPESDGSIDAELNDWTPEQRQRVLQEVRDGLDWWAQQAPEANLNFIIDDHATIPVNTGYEPITHPQYEERLWIGETLAKLGYAGSSYWTQVRDYVNDLRETYQTDWAFAIFVVNSDGDSDSAFSNGYFAYAYLGGPFLVMTYNNAGYGIYNMDAVTAHEVGHSFRALDQYSGANVACDTRSGYLGVETQNSQQPDCPEGVSSIMRGGISAYTLNAVDPYARGQIGWLDSDEDGLFDPVDTTPTLSAELTSQIDSTWTLGGSATDVPFPSPTRPDVTINDVSVEYRIDGSAWQLTTSTDGEFDSSNEAYTLQLDLESSGNHHISLRARNSVGNVSDVAQFVAVVPDPLDGGLDTYFENAAFDQVGSTAVKSLHGVASSYNVDGTPGVPLAGVEYRVDGGAWQAAQSQDGAFDDFEEDFIISLDLQGGTHLIEARAVDAEGKAEQNVAMLQVELNYSTFLPVIHR